MPIAGIDPASTELPRWRGLTILNDLDHSTTLDTCNNFENIKSILETRVNTTGMVQNIIEHESATYDTIYHVKSSICINSKSCLELH